MQTDVYKQITENIYKNITLQKYKNVLDNIISNIQIFNGLSGKKNQVITINAIIEQLDIYMLENDATDLLPYCECLKGLSFIGYVSLDVMLLDYEDYHVITNILQETNQTMSFISNRNKLKQVNNYLSSKFGNK